MNSAVRDLSSAYFLIYLSSIYSLYLSIHLLCICLSRCVKIAQTTLLNLSHKKQNVLQIETKKHVFK